MNDLDTVRALVAPTDPLSAHDHAGAAFTPQALALLARIVRTPRSGPALSVDRMMLKPRRRLVLGTIAVTAGALVSGGLLVFGPGLGDTPAQAATPPVLRYGPDAAAPGGPTLERVAARAAALPGEPVTGPFRYVRTADWALNSAVADGQTTSVLASQQSELWRRLDGTGRSRTTAGSSLVDLVGSRKTLDAVLTMDSTSDQRLTAQMPDGVVPERLADVTHLGTSSVDAFARAVAAGANTQLPTGALAAESIRTLFSQQPVPSTARAAVWEMLATVPGVTDRGAVSDRIGRRGVAITIDDDGSAHGLPVQYLLVIDPSTGQLLEYDEILTTDPGKLNVRIPAVLSLAVYLNQGYTTSVTDRPQN